MNQHQTDSMPGAEHTPTTQPADEAVAAARTAGKWTYIRPGSCPAGGYTCMDELTE